MQKQQWIKTAMLGAILAISGSVADMSAISCVMSTGGKLRSDVAFGVGWQLHASPQRQK